MRKEEFCEILGEINDKHILDASVKRCAKKSVRFQWGVIAACLCLLVVAISGIRPWMEQHNAERQDTMQAPMITIMDKNYVAPNMPVAELPAGYHYLRKLTKEEANNTGLQGCAIYVDPQEDMNAIYLYQECGTPVNEDTVDNTKRQWAYVEWILVSDAE